MNDSIYDKNGRLLYGTIPTQFPEETILKSNTPRMITGSNRKWMIYDSVYTYGDDEEMLLIVFPLLIILIGAIGYFMNGDQTLILRMMMNLITNAINYGKTNGHIHVILKVENDQIVGEVKDDGIGISEEHLDKIWERFYRIDKSRSRENGGTGLGLSMVRWIVNLHNGTIHVESIEDIGTSFIFRFPKI